MNRSILVVFVAMFMIFAGSTAVAATITVGTVTGSGTVSISGGVPTGWAFSGGFNFENTVSYGGFTLAQIFGDVGQFTFGASSAANLAAYDSNGGSDPLAHYKGDVGWLINNTGGPNATIYGSTGSFAFSGAYPTGTVTATLNSDGFIHWYYGYDETVGPPAGMTPGFTNPLFFSGIYTITQDTGGTIAFNLTGNITTQVPEPSLMLLLGIGLGAVSLVGSRWKN